MILSRSYCPLACLVGGLAFCAEFTALADAAPSPTTYTSLRPVQSRGLRMMDNLIHWGTAPNSAAVCLRPVKTFGYSWVTRGAPVTYSFSVGQSSCGAPFVRLIGGSAPVGFASSALARNFISLEVEEPYGSAVRASLLFKVDTTNEPPVIATLSTPSILGTWSLTMSGTNATIKAPDGTEQTAAIPEAALARFADPMSVYFGSAQRNSLDVTLKRLQITGVSEPLDETFDASKLDSSRWEVSRNWLCSSVIVPKDARFWLSSYGLSPYSGFKLQTSTSLLPGSWQDFPIPTNDLIEGRNLDSVFLPMDTNGMRFFRTLGP